MKNIIIDNFNYDLPEERVAKYPLSERDSSKLLLNIQGEISEEVFVNLHNHLADNDLLVFNNSRVVRARLLMKKESGATIEVFCLEPHLPIDFARNFASTGPVRWKCLIGNLKKWKSGKISSMVQVNGTDLVITAERFEKSGESWVVEFDWENRELTFSDILEQAGRIPIPPYLNRKDEDIDKLRYQTIYCNTDGSVAAPTAGLHFTERVFAALDSKGIRRAEVTLHVSAGTFKPVKALQITDHEMHTEHFYVTPETLQSLLSGRVIAVGTTSLRTLESLYWIGVSMIEGKFNPAAGPVVSQWEPYRPHRNIPAREAIEAIMEYIESHPTGLLEAKTSLIIVPGYRFRIVNGLITNFHQPKSTLLLLVAAFAGEKWHEMYDYAIGNDFRFLSYGDSSLIIP
jgi:S-adenosylmethionine:tRNA ribosyltransferase-isomerase